MVVPGVRCVVRKESDVNVTKPEPKIETKSEMPETEHARMRARAAALIPALRKQYPYVPLSTRVVLRMATGMGLDELEKRSR